MSSLTAFRAVAIQQATINIDRGVQKNKNQKTTADIQKSQAEADKEQVYLEYILGDPIVSSYSISSGGDRPSESFSLNFVKISKKYTAFTGAKVGDQPEFKWDLALNKTY